MDNLYGEPAILKYITDSMGLQDISQNVVIVSPDAGGAKRYVALVSWLGGGWFLARLRWHLAWLGVVFSVVEVAFELVEVVFWLIKSSVFYVFIVLLWPLFLKLSR